MFFPLYYQFVKACYVSDGDGFPIRETAFNTMPWATFAGHFAATPAKPPC